jgi:hypothetical protein
MRFYWDTIRSSLSTSFLVRYYVLYYFVKTACDLAAIPEITGQPTTEEELENEKQQGLERRSGYDGVYRVLWLAVTVAAEKCCERERHS